MSDIQLEVHDGIAVVSINRPERLNAFRRSTYDELLAVASRLDRERSWHGLVLTGAGRAFCAGQDLAEIPDGNIQRIELEPLIGRLQDITRELARSAKPTVAAINGPAIGFGLECTLALDLRLANATAYFMLPELSRGLFHTNGTYHYLAQLVGRGLASDMILTGRRIDAEEALRAGLVTRLTPVDELLPRAIEAAVQLAALDTCALAFAKEGLRMAGGGTLEEGLQFETSACLTLLTRGTAR
jgi:enoyl-CoA hydratase/carnithine racemase